MSSNPIVRFFRSVAGKMTAVLALCIFVLVLVNWLLNSFVLLDNYEREQRELLIQSYEELNGSPRSQRTLVGLLEGYTLEYGMGAMLWSDTHVLYSSSRNVQSLNNGFFKPLPLPSGSYEVSNRTPPQAVAGEQWLTLSARTNDGLNLLLWVSLSNVSSGAEITNRFLLWSGVATLLIGALAALLMARSMTKPVRQLSRMAQRMAQLDFSERYVGEGHDELAELGHSLNTVSETLESNLSELKTANARLRGDMEAQARQNEARSRFIRNVSHELKTPLALIQSYAEGLGENAADDAESRAYYCEVIEDEAEKLTQILAKLTMLMQLESGSEELLIDRFDINALLKRAVERYAPLFEEKGAPLPTVTDDPCAVWGDAVLIENVVTNYLTNALNHVTPGGEIRITATPTDHGTVAVTVFNSGNAIPDEDLPHIWESFYKVDKAHTRAYGGTGIGLSVVAAVMTAHGMPFGAENRDGGVAFFFELAAR